LLNKTVEKLGVFEGNKRIFTGMSAITDLAFVEVAAKLY
jgi:hypothetical protein